MPAKIPFRKKIFRSINTYFPIEQFICISNVILLYTLHAASDPSALKSSYFMTSAMMKPFSKSVWMRPAAWGALVFFWRKNQILLIISFYLWKIKFPNLNGPCLDLVRPAGEEVAELERLVPLNDDLVQGTEN